VPSRLGVLGTKYTHGHRLRNYTDGDCEYDFRCAWSAYSDTKPPAYALTAPVSAIVPTASLLPWSMMSSATYSHVDIAAADAVHPVADIVGPEHSPPQPPTPMPTVSPKDMADGIASLTPETFGRLSTDARTIIAMFDHHHCDAQYAAELVTPGGSVMYRLRSAPPSHHQHRGPYGAGSSFVLSRSQQH
jgi:hypothetical protein